MKTASCAQCDRKFHKTTQQAANQALRMHVGRTHAKNIVNGTARLTAKEQNVVMQFIRDRHADYSSRQACFNAAVTAAGLAGKLKQVSCNCNRYFNKAFNKLVASRKPAAVASRKPAAAHKPVVRQVQVNFCPNCGCNIHSVAVGIAEALL